MPSIRVKRDYEYANLDDTIPAHVYPPTRPRSRSWAEFFGPSTSQATPDKEPETPQERHARQRSQTIDEGTLLRQPSKVMHHIMSNTMVPPSSNVAQNRQQDNGLLSDARPSLSSHSRSDMISLEGPQENILIPIDRGHEPGRIGSSFSLPSNVSDRDDLHHDDIVEHLDVIDPEVATVSMLTNAANAIVIPPFPFYSRKPTIVLREIPRRLPTADGAEKGDQQLENNLDRHVQDVLSKRAKFKRVMRGVWAFVKTPIGFIVAIYGFLVIFWGAGIVFFLGKFVNFHNSNTQDYWVELCQQVETGLFTATSIGFIPFRTLDTYRIYMIWYYKRKTRKLRTKAGLPDLYDLDDLPDPIYDENYVHVLTDKDQADLHYQQYKFMQSQTWYRPHGTQTHRAFPITTALWICVLNDLNSFFQVLLSSCMWSMDRHERPAWTTATTLPASFVSGILAACYIWWGGRKTKRHEQVEQRLRAALAIETPPDPPPSPIPDDQLHGPLPTVTSSTKSTPTLPDVQPRNFGDEVRGKDQRQSMDSIASIHITDQMTVPPAEVLIHESHSQ